MEEKQRENDVIILKSQNKLSELIFPPNCLMYLDTIGRKPRSPNTLVCVSASHNLVSSERKETLLRICNKIFV